MKNLTDNQIALIEEMVQVASIPELFNRLYTINQVDQNCVGVTTNIAGNVTSLELPRYIMQYAEIIGVGLDYLYALELLLNDIKHNKLTRHKLTTDQLNLLADMLTVADRENLFARLYTITACNDDNYVSVKINITNNNCYSLILPRTISKYTEQLDKNIDLTYLDTLEIIFNNAYL